MSSAFSAVSRVSWLSTFRLGLRSVSRAFGRLELRPAQRRGAVDDLPLEVGEVHHVEVHDADGAHARRREVERERRAQPAGADRQHPGRLELPLALHPDLRQQQVTRVAQHLRVGELGQLLLRLHRRATARDARHDGEHVARAHRRVGRVEVADVGVVEVQVDEVPQPAVVLHQMALEAAVGRPAVRR